MKCRVAGTVPHIDRSDLQGGPKEVFSGQPSQRAALAQCTQTTPPDQHTPSTYRAPGGVVSRGPRIIPPQEEGGGRGFGGGGPLEGGAQVHTQTNHTHTHDFQNG